MHSPFRWRSTAAVFAAVLFATVLASLSQAATQAVRQRSEIDDQYKWRLEDMYATDEAWEEDFRRLEAGIPALEPYRGHLADSPEKLLACLRLKDSLDIIENNLWVYAYLRLDEDTRVSRYQELGGRIQGLSGQLSEAGSFVTPEIMAIDDTRLRSFLDQSEALAEYRFAIEDLLRSKAHILSPAEEELLAMVGPLARVPYDVFGMIDNADHRMGSVPDPDGNLVELTPGRYTQILRGPDRDYRRRANNTVQASWSRYVNTLTATLNGQIKRDWFFARARKYNSSLEMALDSDSIPAEVYHSLIAAVNDNLESLHKLTRLRKRILGYDTLYAYDLSVPMVPEANRTYSWDEAKRMCLEGLRPLGEKYVADFNMGLNSGWIDVYETEGKASGGYQWGTYSSHPYILMNYADNLVDVFTLAHEMGHALNAHYANRNEPYQYHDQSLFTAEVASTCNEAVLLKYLLDNTASPEEKMILLDYYIEQISGTFILQVMLAEFELTIHEHVENGGAFSVDWIRKTYRDIMQKYYGPDLVIGPENDMGGLKIYHLYRTYYVYQYATCYAAAQVLSQMILDGDPGILDRYHRFLTKGSSKYPINILKDAGVDMTQPEPVARVVTLFGELVDQMDRLVTERQSH